MINEGFAIPIYWKPTNIEDEDVDGINRPI